MQPMQKVSYSRYKPVTNEYGRKGLKLTTTYRWLVILRCNDWYIYQEFVTKPTKRQLRQLRKHGHREQVLHITE